jgi:hypothetical protein
LIGRQVFNTAGAAVYVPTPGARSAIVRGAGGGGGGGGIFIDPGFAGAAAGGNSGTAIEAQISELPFLTGGPVVVGAGGLGIAGNAPGAPGGDSTLLIGGVLLTAPGGSGGSGTGNLNPPSMVFPNTQLTTTGVDYQAADVGGVGFLLGVVGGQFRGGDGGSGDYGLGGEGSGNGPGTSATGNGAGGGGAGGTANQGAQLTLSGGNGSPGLWIIEEYA